MLNFYFNQYDFFSYLKDGNWPPGVGGDGTITGTGNPVPENKVKTQSKFVLVKKFGILCILHESKIGNCVARRETV